MRPRFSDTVWTEQARLYKSGVSASKIGRDLRISTGAVTYHLRKLGLTPRSSSEICRSVVQRRHIGNGLKVCPVCNKAKPLNGFYKDRSKSDGLCRLCKECLNTRETAYAKARTPEQAAARRRAQKTYRDSPRGKAIAKKNSKIACRTLGGRFSNSRSRAIRTEKGWTLTKEQYASLTVRPCEYCDGPLPPTSTGLDRLDNLKGYHLDNVVPCCAICNYARRDQFSPDEMRRFIGPAVKAIRKVRAAKKGNS